MLSDLIFQHLPVEGKVENIEVNRMRNGYIIDILTSVAIQENVEFGGNVIETYEGVVNRVNFKISSCITASKWLTSNQSNSLHSTSQGEHLHTEEWHEDSAAPYWHFRASYESTSTQSSKPINVHNLSTMLA